MSTEIVNHFIFFGGVGGGVNSTSYANSYIVHLTLKSVAGMGHDLERKVTARLSR